MTAMYNPSIIFSLIDPIDCSSDLCHMSWIENVDRNLLTRLDAAKCSNGTLLKDLNADEYSSCAIITNPTLPYVRKLE